MKHKNKHETRTESHWNDDVEDDYVQKKKWYEKVSANLKYFEPVTEQTLIELKEEAKKCLDSEVANYNIKNTKVNSDYRWMKTVTSSGTVSDRIAANTILIQDNPLTNLDLLRNLVSMVKVSKKKECITVMDTLTELFLSDLLRRDTKLKPFHQQPLSQLNEISSGNAVTRKKYLSYWYYEDQLKEIYTSFVLALNTAVHDTLDTNKEKAISAMYRLLAGNPEQEKNLLCYIVNKLGDPSQKVASKAIYCLCQLLYKHSNMQGIVLSEVEKLLFRPNVATRAQYYGLCFLSQFYLSHDSAEIARKLIEVYFSFFKACIKKGEVDSRMMSALLMGVNRAYPYAKLELKSITEHIDTLYRVAHVANFNIGLHTLSLLYQVSDHANNVNDRFYSALYKKLIDPKLSTTTYQAMLLNLIYKALLKDVEVPRVKAFIKRLLQLALFMQPAFSCGILFLVSQVMSKKHDLFALELTETDPVDVKFEDDDDECETYKDVKDDVVIKIEDDEESESNILHQTNPDSNEKPEDEPEDVKPDVEILNADNKIIPSWFHRAKTNSKKSGAPKCYDPLNRNPLFAGGEHCAYLELLYLKNHFHPSVSLFANKILNGETITYPGDPLKDFMLIRFLDRFAFKNPKKLEDPDKKGAHPTFGKRKFYRPGGLRSLAINSANYLNQNEQNIPVDELFVYTFLQRRAGSRQKEDGEESEDESDLESVASEEFEEMLDKMMGHKKGDGGGDDELDFMNDIGDKLKKQKGKKNKSNEDNEGDSDDGTDEEEQDDDDDFSNDEEVENVNEDEDDLKMDEDDKLLIGDLDEDDDLSDIAFDSDNEENNKTKKKNKKRKGDFESVFASADEFASLLEDEGSAKRAPGGSNAYSNKDNADLKQIAWEEKQRRWLKGFDEAVGAGGKKGFNNKFGKKRPGSSKFDGRSKKQRKP